MQRCQRFIERKVRHVFDDHGRDSPRLREIDAQAVVDSQLRVHGLLGLRVADASVTPTIPASNINAAAIMTGEKAADMILQAARSSR